MSREVDAHLLLEARPVRIGTANRHRAAVDLHHEIQSLAVRKLKPEDKVGDRAHLAPPALVRELCAERERCAVRSYRLPECGGHLLGGDEPDITVLRHGTLERHLKIDDLDLVLDERAADLAVLPAPVAGAAEAIALTFRVDK